MMGILEAPLETSLTVVVVVVPLLQLMDDFATPVMMVVVEADFAPLPIEELLPSPLLLPLSADTELIMFS